jgi:hypothetical protein
MLLEPEQVFAPRAVELGLETATLVFLIRCAPEAGPANSIARRLNHRKQAWRMEYCSR